MNTSTSCRVLPSFGARSHCFQLLVIVMVGCGCSSNARVDLHEALLEVSEVDIPGGSNVSNKKTDAAFREVVGKCSNVLNKLESRGDRRRTKLFAISVTGAIAGSVAAPAVIATEGSMALSTSLSGLSGVANTAQQLFGDEGYTRAELVLARENIVVKLNSYVDQWLRLEGIAGGSSTTAGRAKINAKIGLLHGMVVACSMYPLAPTQPSKEVQQLVDGAAETASQNPAGVIDNGADQTESEDGSTDQEEADETESEQPGPE